MLDTTMPRARQAATSMLSVPVAETATSRSRSSRGRMAPGSGALLMIAIVAPPRRAATSAAATRSCSAQVCAKDGLRTVASIAPRSRKTTCSTIISTASFAHYGAPHSVWRSRHLDRGGVGPRPAEGARVGDDSLAPEGRVGEDERAAFNVLDAHLARRALGERLEVAPAPVHRRVLRPGRDRRDALVAVPQRMDVGALERLDQRRIAAHQLLSTDAEPGPLTTMYNIAPISARFFRKWLIWLTRCAGSYSQNRCAMPVAITT